MSDKAFLVLEPFGPDFALPDTPRDHNYLSVVISRYQQVEEYAARLAAAGWVTETSQEGAGIVVLCHPPEDVETEQEVYAMLEKLKMPLGDLGFVDVEDLDYDVDEDDFGDDEECPCGGCEFCDDDLDDEDFSDEEWKDHMDDEDEYEGTDVPLMPPEMAESLVGHTITKVQLVDDHRVVFDLDDDRKLVYDEDDFGFTLV